MMRPAEQHAVVGVRGAAPRMLRHVVDLAPGCRNDASAIAGADRSALVGVEKTFGGAEVHDAPVRIEDDLLNRSGAGDAVRERRGNRGMRALDACGAVIEVVDRRRDDQRRRDQPSEGASDDAAAVWIIETTTSWRRCGAVRGS